VSTPNQHNAPLRIDPKQADAFLKQDRPSRSRELVFQCIIVSLMIHIVVLFVTQMLTEDNRIALPEEQYMPLEAELIAPEDIVPAPEQVPPQGGPLRNVVANQHSTYSNEVRDYRGMSAQEMRQAGADAAKAAEQAEFDRLAAMRKPGDLPQKRDAPSGSNQPKNENDWFNDPNKKSYNGAVTAAYALVGRESLYDPKPSYLCRISGTVVVQIVVDQLGKVVDARVQGGSSANDCLIEQSINYARKWTFNYKEGRARQEGTITFTFSAQ
jgi:TonB family protein